MRRQLLIKIGAVALLAGLVVGGEAAADLGKAKAAGLVCETPGGYLRVARGDAPPDIHTLVKSVNNARQVEYQRIATANGVTVAQVAALTAQKVIGSAPQHQCR